MDYQQINFADLQEQYYDQPRTRRALKLLNDARAGKETGDMSNLLRHHDEATIYNEETYERDSFDFLLAYYSLLEIACLIRYVPSAFPDAFREESLWNLSHRAVKHYYEENYPVLMPRLFRLRLEGNLSLHQPGTSEETHPLFLRFLGMVNRVREDEEIELFQWFLDGGSTGGYDIDETLKLLQSPKDTLNAFIEHARKHTIPEKSIRGAQKFLAFCGEFDGLLREAQPYPLFQSAMWTYYSYWFDLIGTKVVTHVGHILDSFRQWDTADSAADPDRQEEEIESHGTNFDENAPTGTVGKQLGKPRKGERMVEQDLKADRKAIDEYVSASRGVIVRLFSSSYGEALRSVTPVQMDKKGKERPRSKLAT